MPRPRKEQQGATDYPSRYPGAQEVTGAEGWNWQWTKPGQELVGTFIVCEPFKNGNKAKVRDTDGVVRLFSCPDQLADMLREIRPGDNIAIVFDHEKPPRVIGHNPTKYFRVFRLPS